MSNIYYHYFPFHIHNSPVYLLKQPILDHCYENTPPNTHSNRPHRPDRSDPPNATEKTRPTPPPNHCSISHPICLHSNRDRCDTPHRRCEGDYHHNSQEQIPAYLLHNLHPYNSHFEKSLGNQAVQIPVKSSK